MLAVLLAVVVSVTTLLVPGGAQRVARASPAREGKIDEPITVQDGLVQGVMVNGTNGTGRAYIAFRGIPYAAKPVGDLRFKNPRPVEPWGGVKNESVEGSKCVQISVPNGTLEGSEDCLYLNVYVPVTNAPDAEGNVDDVSLEKLLPVMVYIHGGGFQYGSGSANETGPDFLVDKGVLLVTFNYRLGVLGFANLDTDDIPGNMGLKDQRAALLWVQNNIDKFGGNPQNVTIFGNDAGAASVHYHTIVRPSRGLFQAAIMQSGNALAPWAYQETHLTMAWNLSKILGGNVSIVEDGAPDKPDYKAIADVLRQTPAYALLNATKQLIESDPTLHFGIPPFVPSPEKRTNATEEVFLTKDPESIVRAPTEPRVPTIMGFSGNEGIFAFYAAGFHKNFQNYSFYAQNLPSLMPANLDAYPDTKILMGLRNITRNKKVRYQECGHTVNNRYWPYSLNHDLNRDGFIRLLGDMMHVTPLTRLINYTTHPEGSPPMFVYHFLENGFYTWGQKVLGIAEQGGPSHTDELGYLMRITYPLNLKQDLRGRTISSTMLQRLTTMWTDFAKTHHPTPNNTNCWPPTQSTQAVNFGWVWATNGPDCFVSPPVEFVNIQLEAWLICYRRFRIVGA